MKKYSHSGLHQQCTDLSKQQSGTGPSGQPAFVIQSVGKSLKNTALIGDIQGSDQVEHHDSQSLGQSVGRQVVRRIRHRTERS